MPKLVLAFPPYASATSPPLGVCALKGHLRKTVPEWEVVVEDLNLRVHAALVNSVRNGGRLNPGTFHNGPLDEAALLRADEVFHGLHTREFYYDPERYTLYGDMLLRLFDSEMRNSFLLEEVLRNNQPLPPLIHECAGLLLAAKPDVIGISTCYSQQAWFSFAIARALRERSACPIIFGGTFFFGNIEKILRTLGSIATAVISCEGEKALEIFLQSGCELQGVPGVHYLHRGNYLSTEAQMPADLDSLGLPDFSDLEVKSYFSPEPVIPVLTSRGCYWRKCAFCTHHKSAGMTYRCRSTAQVIEELKKHVDGGYSNFSFIDEMIPPARFRQLSEEILKNNLSINFYALARPEKQFTPELLALMHASGLRYILWGVESGNQRVLDLMQKGTKVEDVGQVLNYAHKAEIRNHCYIIVGFPTETLQEARDTMLFLEKHKEYISQVHRGTFTLDETSPIAAHPSAFGITKMWPRTESIVGRPLGYETSSGMSQDEAREAFASFLPFLRGFNPYSRILGSYRDHALLIYSRREQELDMTARRFPPWR